MVCFMDLSRGSYTYVNPYFHCGYIAILDCQFIQIKQQTFRFFRLNFGCIDFDGSDTIKNYKHRHIYSSNVSCNLNSIIFVVSIKE